MKINFLLISTIIFLLACNSPTESMTYFLEADDEHPALNLNYPLAIYRLEQAIHDSLSHDESIDLQIDKIQLGILYCEEGDVKKAFNILSAVSESSENKVELERYIHTGWAGYFTKIGRPDSAFHHIQIAAELYANDGVGKKDFEISMLNLLGEVYLQMGAYEAARIEFKSALEKLEKKYGDTVGVRAILLTNLGFIYGREGNHTEEFRALEEARKIIDNLPHVSSTPKAFFYHQQVQHYLHVIESKSSLQPEKNPFTIPEVKAAYKKAIVIQKLALEEIEKVPQSLNTALIYNDYAELCMTKGNKRRAKKWVLKAEKLMLQFLEEESYYYAGLMYIKGAIFISCGEYDLGRQYEKQSIELADGLFSGMHPMKGMAKLVEAVSFIIPGIIKKNKDLINQGLTGYEEAAAMFSGSKIFDEKQEFPIYQEVNDYLALREIMQYKGNLYYENQWIASNQQEALTQALQSYQAAAALNEKILLTFPFMDAQESTLAHTIRHHTSIIEICDSLFQLTNQEKYKEKAFYYTEKSKATRLLLTLRIAKTTIKAPAQKRIQLRLDEKSRQIAKLKRLALFGVDQSGIDSITSQLFRVRQSYEKDLIDFKKEFPLQYDCYYSLEPLSVKEIQQNLSQKQAVLEFYIYNGIRVFVITADTFFLFTTPIPEKSDFRHLPRDMWAGIEEGGASNSKAAYRRYCKAANEIYYRFFEKPLQQLSGVDELFVIGGGGISRLPLEILLMEKPTGQEPDYSLENLSYLFEKYSLSYAYSASTLFLSKVSKDSSLQELVPYVAFAPTFDQYNQSRQKSEETAFENCDDKRFNTLKGQDTLMLIKDLFNGEIQKGKGASKRNFASYLPKSQVLHLYTHGCLDTKNQLSSMLIFSDSSLLASDIYAMKTSAELVVLTACQTAGGEVSTGEGVIGIANAFAYAGCPSVVAGFWEIPEKESRAITHTFFKYLHEGMPKHKALRQAKLDYLEKYKGYRITPYKWAGLVHIGRVDPLSL